jgi:hypothetical protein
VDGPLFLPPAGRTTSSNVLGTVGNDNVNQTVDTGLAIDQAKAHRRCGLRVDRFLTPVRATFAANIGARTGVDLNASASNAIAAAFALAGGGAAVVAAQLTFGGRTYLAIDQVSFGAFADDEDLLLDITGMTGSIAASSFI